jgi:hypothetical protein
MREADLILCDSLFPRAAIQDGRCLPIHKVRHSFADELFVRRGVT